MSNKPEANTVKDQSERELKPKLRFPEFREAEGWKSQRLGDLFSDRQESGLSGLPLLSLMDKEGIIPQENSNRKNNSNSDKSKYLRVVPGDIVYNTMRMWEGRSAYVGLEGLVTSGAVSPISRARRTLNCWMRCRQPSNTLKNRD